MNEIKSGLGETVVLDLISELPDLPEEEQYELYFDNFFTNLPLLSILLEEGFRTTSRIRANRAMKCSIKPVELL